VRVLVANHHLAQRRGSEVFTETLVRELLRRGHAVDVFAFVFGEVASRLPAEVRLVSREALERETYDLALISHNTCQRAVGRRAPVVVTCHGTVPAEEQPCGGADRYVAVSSEVADHLRSSGFDATIILNGVDCERFSPAGSPSPELRRVLLLSNYDGAIPIVREACDRAGVEFRRVGGAHGCEDIAAAINGSDLVVTVGRGVYEALACGRNVVVFDRRDYDAVQGADGFVTPERLPAMIRCNCSGRAFGMRWGVDELADAFTAYDPALAGAHRAFAVEHFDVRKSADRYLSLA
jgi:glycosyltransferase involved in cell wall biosynthesis